MKRPAHHPRKPDRKRGTITAAGVDHIPLATSALLADISWNPTRSGAKWACFYSFPHHPLSLFSLTISSGTFYSLLQCIRSAANFFYVWMLLCSISAFFCQDQGSHDLPAHVMSWCQVCLLKHSYGFRGAETQSCYSEWPYRDSANPEKTFFPQLRTCLKKQRRLSWKDLQAAP